MSATTRLILGVYLLCAVPSVRADWAGFSRYRAVAEIAIEPHAAHLNLRMLDSALPRLAQLTAVKDWPDIAGRLLIVRDREGHPLRALAAGTGLAHPAADGLPAFHEMEFDVVLPEGAKAISLAPPVGATGEDVGLIALHGEVPVADLAPVTQPITLHLDASDPWRSHFESLDFARRHAEPRSYLYVEPYEVRHEILLRLADLSPWLDLKPGVTLEPAARNELQRRIGEVLTHHNPLVIDGAAVMPQLDRVEFVRFSRQGVQPVGEADAVNTTSALVGVMLSYLTEHPAQQLALDWDMFSPGLQRRAVSVIQGRESFDGDLTPNQPRFAWSRADSLEPIPATAPEPATAASAQQPLTADTLAALLHNAYRAFALRGEEAAYDRLAKSLEGELLEDIYLQQRRARLRLAEGLGGEGRVDRIELLHSAIVAGPDDYRVDARWIAHGTVSHWGHSHPRHNLYAARLRVRPGADGTWKITAMDFQGGQRLEAGA